MSYTFGNRAASSDVYLPFDSIEDGHFDIPISQAGKVWLHAHKGLTRVGNDTCRSGTRKEMRSGDIIDAGGIKFRCMTVHKEEETGGPPQTRFIMHGSGDHSAVAEASEEGITIHETVLPKDIYLDADPAKMRVEHFLWQCLEDETEDKADIAAVLESNLAEKAVAMEPNVSIAFLTQTKSGSSILVLLSNDSIDSLRDIGRVSCPSPLAHVRIMLRYSRRSYQCGGADISLDFPGIQLAHFAIQVGDKDGDNLWIHTHNGAIFVDDVRYSVVARRREERDWEKEKVELAEETMSGMEIGDDDDEDGDEHSGSEDSEISDNGEEDYEEQRTRTRKTKSK